MLNIHFKDIDEAYGSVNGLFYQQGQGYSLAADIQYVDARSEIPVVLPLRDCTSQELNMLCKLDRSDDMYLFNLFQSSHLCLIFPFEALFLVREEENWQALTLIKRDTCCKVKAQI